MKSQSENKSGYDVHVSTHTQQILRRLNSSSHQTLSPDSFLLEELLTALNKDQYVLQLLGDDLKKYHGKDIDPDLLLNAQRKCMQLDIECDVTGANSALFCGATEKAVMILRKMSQKELSIVPPELKPFLFTLYVSVAWLTSDLPTVDQFLHIARQMDVIAKYSEYLDSLRGLLQARSELFAGRSDAAIRICQSIVRKTKPGEQINCLALELEADAFRRMGDVTREQKVLEDWENILVRMYPNGPCDLAVIAEAMKSPMGISGCSRSEEILQHYSRLAILYEKNPDNQSYAKGIYTKFMNNAYHRWIDSSQSDKGSIEERLSRIKSPIERKKENNSEKSVGITVFDPERSFGKISERTLEELLANLTITPTSSLHAVVVKQIDLKERHFTINKSSSDPRIVFFTEINSVLKDASCGYSFFSIHKTSVLWKGHIMEWYILSHQENAPDVAHLSFGVRADIIGNKMDIAIYVLYVYPPPLNIDSKKRLTELLKIKLEELQGYYALEGNVIDIVKRSARRVEQNAGERIDIEQQKGPIRL